jgi:hypothetical protein
MKSFRKFEFLPADWEKLKKDIQQTTTTPSGEVTTWKDCAVVELGFICLEWGQVDDKPVCTKQSDKWAVDILFYAEVPTEFEPFAVYPNPCGVHTFSGDESLYLKSFCAKFPESDYCKLPEPVITNEAL